MTKAIAIDVMEKRVILPVSKKLIEAVGMKEDLIYTARFENGLLFIGESLEDMCSKIYEQAKKIGYDDGYETGYNEGYDEGFCDGKERTFVKGYRQGYDDAVEGAGYCEKHFSDCGLDCDYDCEHCRFNGK